MIMLKKVFLSVEMLALHVQKFFEATPTMPSSKERMFKKKYELEGYLRKVARGVYL